MSADDGVAGGGGEAGASGWLLSGVLPRFWRLLGRQQGDHIGVRDVDLALALAAAQTFLAAEVKVGWFDGGGLVGVIVRGPHDRRGEDWTGPAPEPPASGLRFEALPLGGVVSVSGAAGPGLLLQIGPLLDSGWSPAGERVATLQAELQASVAGLRAMWQTVGTVRGRSAVGEENQHLRRVADAELELQYLLFHDRRGLRAYLVRAAKFTEGHLRPLLAGGPKIRAEALRLAERLSRRLMHRVLELGGADGASGLRAAAACERERDALTAILSGLRFDGEGPSGLDLGRRDEEAAQRHAAALWVLGAMLQPSAPTLPPLPPIAELRATERRATELRATEVRATELRLFVVARAHQAAIDHGRADPAGWASLTDALKAALGPMLSASAVSGGPSVGRARSPNDINAVRAWTRLWLLHELVHQDPVELQRYAADVCALLVELLRQKVFYGADPAVVAARSRRATAALVHHHLQTVVGLGGADARGTRRLIARGRPGRGLEDGAEHVEHVLDHYLLGQLLWSAKLRRAVSPVEGTLGMALAGAGGRWGGQTETKRLQAALGLASLSHDAGLAYFPQLDPTRVTAPGAHGEPVAEPERSPLKGTSGADDPALAEALAARAAALREAGRTFVSAATAALIEAGVITDAGARTADQPPIVPLDQPALEGGRATPLGRWLIAQNDAGQVDHALSSAFVLLRAAERGQVAPEVWGPAVRAVLLHGPANQPVLAEADPVAALLILIDEALSWDPEHRGEDGVACRTAELAIFGLQRALDPATGRMVHSLPEVASGPTPLRVELRLGHLERPEAMAFPDWITAAQAIGRIDSGEFGLQPALELRGPVPPRLRRVGLGTRALLEQLRANPDLPSTLDALLSNHLIRNSDVPDADLEEVVRLARVSPEALVLDARPLLPDLLLQADVRLPRADG